MTQSLQLTSFIVFIESPLLAYSGGLILVCIISHGLSQSAVSGDVNNFHLRWKLNVCQMAIVLGSGVDGGGSLRSCGTVFGKILKNKF